MSDSQAGSADVIEAVAVADNDLLGQVRLLNEPVGWLDRLSDFGSQFCSSILVKEARQAMSSRQFLWTYLALLAVCALWAIVGLTFSGSRAESGPAMLFGFYTIIGVPLAIIVPFSAFRSLVREFEDGTIQLVSITTMKPYQIVAGKMGSAMLQLLVYLSVLAPCIAFTYLLRGIGVEQIVAGLVVSIFGCLVLTAVGLFLAGVTRSGLLNVGVSVVLIAALIGVYFAWVGVAGGITHSNILAGDDFWNPDSLVALFGFFAFFGSFGVLLFVSAASQISFPTENRTTAVRIVTLGQQVLCFAWIIAAAVAGGPNMNGEFGAIMCFIVGHFWLVIGFLMSSESWPLSDRVARQLPTTFLGRTFTSLLMPGPGRGFLFAAANVIACTVMTCLILVFSSESTAGRAVANFAGAKLTADKLDGMCSAAFGSIYILWFLAVVFLLMAYRRKRRPNVQVSQYNPLVSLLIGVLLVLGCCLGPVVMQYGLTSGAIPNDYTILQTFNWYWTVIELAEEGTWTAGFAGALMFTLQAVPVILIAVAVASRELLIDPTQTPNRVIAERAQQQKQELPPGESIEEIFGDLD